ncbi:hypothetical protein T439DRAFT_327711 [Meredithblackwellia eburnea MCA 4105]
MSPDLEVFDLGLGGRSTREGSVASSKDDSEEQGVPIGTASLRRTKKGPTINHSCGYCRRSKMKCVRESPSKPCKRCAAARIDCVILERRVRKRRGSSEPEAPPTNSQRPSDEVQTVLTTPVMPALTLPPAPALLSSQHTTLNPIHITASQPPPPQPHKAPTVASSASPTSHFPSTTSAIPSAPVGGPSNDINGNEDVTRGVTTSPLDLLLSATRNTTDLLDLLPQEPLHQPELGDMALSSPAGSSLLNVRPRGFPAGDPISLSICSEHEARILHGLYWDKQQRVANTLHPPTDTFESTRKRSPLLFTSICSVACRFLDQAETLSIRLDRHVDHLVADAVVHGRAELETVQAFLTLCPWMPPVRDELQDRTSRYLSLAISLYREVMDYERSHKVSLSQEEVRARQRSLLIMSIFDVGVSLMHGRPITMMADAIVEGVESWSEEAIAIPTDNVLAAIVALRRNMAASSAVLNPSPTAPGIRPSYLGFHTIRAILTDLFEGWERTWMTKDYLLDNKYLKVVRQHSELSMLVFALGRGSGGKEATKPLIIACMHSANAVCNAALEFAAPDAVVPNNTMVMVAYAALLIIKVHDLWAEAFPEDQGVVDRLRSVASHLNTLGNCVPHRKGKAAVCGQRLTDAIDTFLASTSTAPRTEPNDLYPFGLAHDLSSQFYSENPEMDFLLQSLPAHEHWQDSTDNWLSMLTS